MSTTIFDFEEEEHYDIFNVTLEESDLHELGLHETLRDAVEHYFHHMPAHRASIKDVKFALQVDFKIDAY